MAPALDADLRIRYTETGDWGARERVEFALTGRAVPPQVVRGSSLERRGGTAGLLETAAGVVFERVMPVLVADPVRTTVRVVGEQGDTLAIVLVSLPIQPDAHHWVDVSVGHHNPHAQTFCAGRLSAVALGGSHSTLAETVYVYVGALPKDAVC